MFARTSAGYLGWDYRYRRWGRFGDVGIPWMDNDESIPVANGEMLESTSR